MVIENVLKINYIVTYTTILKKQDSDYYLALKVAHIAETRKANTGLKFIINKSMCMAMFNETLSCLVAKEPKQTVSTSQKHELCSSP